MEKEIKERTFKFIRYSKDWFVFQDDKYQIYFEPRYKSDVYNEMTGKEISDVADEDCIEISTLND